MLWIAEGDRSSLKRCRVLLCPALKANGSATQNLFDRIGGGLEPAFADRPPQRNVRCRLLIGCAGSGVAELRIFV